jgi:peptidyl-prolyl cis-trans isomerase A (cyclophilin A)
MKKILSFLFIAVIIVCGFASCSSGLEKTVVFETTMGIIEFKLYSDTPIASRNMIDKVNDGFYNNVFFHRVIPDFMIQAGNPVLPGLKNGQMELDPHPGRPNVRGAISMASSSLDKPIENQSDCQFFINVADNAHLDPSFINQTTRREERGFGFIPFAHVTTGIEVCDKISKVERDGSDNPKSPITILRAYVK